ncbi:MAG: hypothetical protein ACRD8A_04800 [Candidatus Acidiferrales bacterium]
MAHVHGVIKIKSDSTIAIDHLVFDQGMEEREGLAMNHNGVESMHHGEIPKST